MRKIRTYYWRLFTKPCYDTEEKESWDDINKISKSKLIEEKAELMIDCDTIVS